MRHIFAVESTDELMEYQRFVDRIQNKLNDYLIHLKREYQVCELPEAVLWASGEIATKMISTIPIPAYTNEYRIVMCPDLNTWRDIYLHQLDGVENAEEIRDYYMNGLSENHVLQILGHELAHHSEYFPDSDYEEGIWFEEGMVEFISRRYFLTEEEFEREAEINRKLVDLLSHRLGDHSIDAFGAATYTFDYADIFFEYWRSFLAVEQIIKNHNGDIQEVFSQYRQWCESDRLLPLETWFCVNEE